MASFKIYDSDNIFEIGKDVFNIAEIGSTHCANFSTAKTLINIAYNSGADCVKFQKRDIESLLTKRAREKEYKSVNAMARTYGEHREIMEFSEQQFIKLQKYAHSKGMFFTASAWDKKSVDFLDSLNIPFFKIASADLTNLPLLEYIAKKKRPIFLSTGMGTSGDVRTAVSIISQYEKRIVVLQCTSSYPTPYNHINLKVLYQYQEEYPECVVGYSGHEPDNIIPVVAVGMGARVIEKHVTLDKQAIGSDHKSALDPDEYRDMIINIRKVEQALGHCPKSIQPSEYPCFEKLCKSVTTTRPIKNGDVISKDMITTKSPGTGISSKMFYDVIGKRATRDLLEDETLMADDIRK